MDFIRDVPTALFVFMCVLPGLMFLAPAVALIKAWKLAHQTSNTPVGSIAEAHDGIVAIEGRVDRLLTGSLHGPLTGRPCCWYRSSVDTWVKRERLERTSRKYTEWEWQSGEEVTSKEPLLVVDRTGICAVWAEHADVYTSTRSIWYGNTPIPEGPPLAGDTQSEPAEKDRRYRYLEDRLRFGDEVYATGEISHDREGLLEPEMKAALPQYARHLVMPFSQRGSFRVSLGSCGDEIGRHTEEMKKTFIVASMGAAGVLGLLLIRFGVMG